MKARQKVMATYYQIYDPGHRRQQQLMFITDNFTGHAKQLAVCVCVCVCGSACVRACVRACVWTITSQLNDLAPDTQHAGSSLHCLSQVQRSIS